MKPLKERLYGTLRSSERVFKTDMVYLVRGSFWYTVNTALGILSSFILAISFSRLVPKEVYGNYKYILSIAGILSAVTLTGMNVAVTRAVALGNEGTFKRSLSYQLKWNLTFFAAAAVIGGYYLSRGNLVVGWSLMVVGVLSPVLNSANTYGAFLEGKKDFRRLAQYSFFSNITGVGALIATMLLTSNVMWLVIAYMGTATAANAFFCWRIFRVYQPNDQVDPQALSYGSHLSIMNILTGIADRIDSILMFHFLGSAQLANYSFAAAPPEQLKGLFKQIGPLALPKFAEKEWPEIKKTLRHKMMLILIVASATALAYIIAAPWIFRILFPKYVSVVNLSRIYALILPLYFTQPINAILQAHKKTKALYLTSNATAAIWIGSVFVGIYFWGILGAVVAQIVWRAISAIIGLTVIYWKEE